MSKLTARIKASGKLSRPVPREMPMMPVVTAENRHDIIRQVVSPMHVMPYEEQLKKKESFCRNALRLLANNLMQSGTKIRVDVRRLPCPIQPIRSSPLTRAYRNKSEYSIWNGYDGKPTVGFFTYSIGKTGDTVCVEPNEIEIERPNHIKIADVLQDYIRNVNKVGLSYSLGTQGGWRRFIVRSNMQGDLMVIGQLNPRTLNVRQVLDEKERFTDHLLNATHSTKYTDDDGEEKSLSLKSLYVQQCPHSRCSHQQVPYELLHGDPVLHETFNDFIVQVSPETFIQQNTVGAQVLYNTIIDAIRETSSSNGPQPLAIDACTGTGLIAMHLAKQVASRVIAIDSSQSAIDDAKQNVKTNQIDNVEFICSQLEIVLERVLEKYKRQSRDVLLVCNPPRTGLQHAAIDAIRECRNIRRLVYVSCKPDGAAMDNFIQLCRRQVGRHLPPFVPITAIPVDMFPHTEHSELIIVFERQDE